jgi:hypothetical protein
MIFDELIALSSAFERLAQEQSQPALEDPALQSPNIVVEPLNPVVDKAIKVLQRMDPSYFVGVKKIVINVSPYYGHVESGPGKDPTVININMNRIMSESGGQVSGPTAVLAAATTIAHEKGHVASFNESQGFVGGEGPAEAEEGRVRAWIESHMSQLQDLLT